MVAIGKLVFDPINIRDLIEPGVGNRRIFRILLTNACRYSCDFCPMRAERDLPPRALEPASLARLFMTAFRRGWCDGLFVTSGIPRDPVFAMERMLEFVETLRVAHGYRGYLHAKGLAGAEPGQIERLVRLVDRVSYNLEAACRQAMDEHAECGRAADKLVHGENGHLPLDRDPKLTWALAHPGRFPVELMTASREELHRVPGFGPLAVERIVSTRALGFLRDAPDLKRLGVQVGRSGGFVTLRGRPIGTRAIQTPLFATASKRVVYGFNQATIRCSEQRLMG